MPGNVDADLISRLCNRDSEALGALFDIYSRRVYSLFLVITRDPAAAEDLVQELFLRAWNRAPHFNSVKGSLQTWLMSMARNMAIDHLRSGAARFGKRLQWITDLEELSLVEDSGAAMNSAVSVKSALKNLKISEQRVLELAYVYGYTQSEMARLLQQPLGTVKSSVRSALYHLRSAMLGDGHVKVAQSS